MGVGDPVGRVTRSAVNYVNSLITISNIIRLNSSRVFDRFLFKHPPLYLPPNRVNNPSPSLLVGGSSRKSLQ
jgi:hypothetical protein